jgi:hypothetical protein
LYRENENNGEKQMNYIKEILRNYFVSYIEYSNIAGIDPSHVNRLFKRKHQPMLKTIRTLAQALSRIDGKEWTIHAKHIQEETELKKVAR